MTNPITLPTPAEVAELIRACRDELAALKRLQRLARAAAAAGEARARRRDRDARVGPNEGAEE